MATDPDDIRLSPAHKDLLASRAAETGKEWSEVFREAMDLWEKRRTAVSAVVDGLRQSDRGDCADGEEVFERLQKRAQRTEAAARKS